MSGAGLAGDVVAPRVRWGLSAACRCNDRVRRQSDSLASFETMRGSAEVSDARRVHMGMKTSRALGTDGTFFTHTFRPGDLALVGLKRSVETFLASHVRSGGRTGRHVSVDPWTTAEGSAFREPRCGRNPYQLAVSAADSPSTAAMSSTDQPSARRSVTSACRKT